MIDPAALAPVVRYRLLIGCVAPRPIAWISTADPAGRGNLAPFSAFQIVTASPLTVSVAIAHRDPPKDTWRNLEATGEAVVHLVPGGLLDAMHTSAAEHPHGVSEAELAGLRLLSAERVRPPRLADADIALECRLDRVIPVGEPVTRLCLLSVVGVHIAPAIAGTDGLPDPARFRPVARLGGDHYLLPDGWRTVAMARPRRPT